MRNLMIEMSERERWNGGKGAFKEGDAPPCPRHVFSQ